MPSTSVKWLDQRPPTGEVWNSTRMDDLTKKSDLARNWLFTLLTDPDNPDPVIQRFKTRWAPKTWQKKRRLIDIVATAFGAPIGDILQLAPDLIAVIFCQAIEDKLEEGTIKYGTAQEYAGKFASLLPMINPRVLPSDVAMLRAFSASFQREGAAFPTDLAVPMDQETVRSLINNPRLDVDLRSGIFLAWKTVSRWDDIYLLELPLRLLPPGNQLFINFLDNTKTSGEKPYDPRFLAIVDWGYPDSTVPPPDVLHHLTYDEGLLCLKWPTSEIEKLLRPIPVPASCFNVKLPKATMKLRDHFTAHSEKRGAIRLAYARLLEVHSDPDTAMKIVMRISKHANPRKEEVSADQIRYLLDALPVAQALQTNLVSRIL